MQLLRETLRGRSTQAKPQQFNTGCDAKADATNPSALKPAHRRHRFVAWALSALGVPPPSPTAPGQLKTPTGPTPREVHAPAAVPSPGRLRVAIVGDVHGSWQPDREEAALRLLDPHLTLLVGDFGNENVELVRQVASLPLRKAVILGNHDAWYTMTGRSGGTTHRGAVQQMLSAADLLAAMSRGEGTAPEQDGVRKQLAALGQCHVGYGTMRLDEHGYTVVGARPFSKGGRSFSSIRAFMEGLYGVTSMDESAARIVQVGKIAPEHHALIMMGHNGPAGLGSRAFDICGVDWEARAGDHGDPDLQAALEALQHSGRRIALVTFGHMHHRLHGGSRGESAHRLRRMVALNPATGTVYLNAATVPRVIPAPSSAPQAVPTASPRAASRPPGSGRRARMAAKAAAAAASAALPAPGPQKPGTAPTLHHIMVAELEDGAVVSAQDVWVQVIPVTDGTAEGVLQAAMAAEAKGRGAAAGAVQGAEGGTASEDDSEDGGDGGGSQRGACMNSGTAGPRRFGDFVVQIAREHVVLRTVVGAEGGVVKFVWNAHDQVYEPYVLQNTGAAAAVIGCDEARADDGGGSTLCPAVGEEDVRRDKAGQKELALLASGGSPAPHQ